MLTVGCPADTFILDVETALRRDDVRLVCFGTRIDTEGEPPTEVVPGILSIDDPVSCEVALLLTGTKTILPPLNTNCVKMLPGPLGFGIEM